MPRVVERARDLLRLHSHLVDVEVQGRGRFLALYGRRQVGKSTLAQQFVATQERPHVFFSATFGADPAAELERFSEEVARSDLEASEVFRRATPRDWLDALELLARATTVPSIVVLDELPWLLASDPRVEGVLQTAWDRVLSTVPLLLIVIGSDLAVMELLGTHARPLFGRLREMRVDPLDPALSAELLDLDPVSALDAYLVTGGFPLVLSTWGRASTVTEFVAAQLEDPTSPLVVVGERVLAGELSGEVQAGRALRAIGSGERTFTAVSSASGLVSSSLDRALGLLATKRIVAAEVPLIEPGRLRRYRVADTYLRFWLHFIGPSLELVLRGRGRVVAEGIDTAWRSYAGRAVEPLVREAIERLLPDPAFADARYVGAYWNRVNDPEVDLVGAADERPAISDRTPDPLSFVGSIKWRATSPFGRADHAELVHHRSRTPGAARARLVAVSRTGFDPTGLVDVELGPEELLGAWR